MCTITMQVQLTDEGFQAVFRIVKDAAHVWTLSPCHLDSANMNDALREAAARVPDLQRRYN
jgi:hypothetical protein